MEKSSAERRGIRSRGGFIISGLTGGHGVFHWFSQSFLVMLPEVQEAFKLSAVAVGAIATTRELVSGIVTLPGGIMADVLRRHWGLVLALCMAGFGLGWLLIGLSPVYPLLLAGMALVGMAASIWHLPAMASLSHHFSDRRGTALSFHGVGGQIGDAVAPPLTGILLGFLSWRGIISIYAVVPLFLAFVVFWAFRNIGRTAEAEPARHLLHDQMGLTKQVLKNPTVWGINFVAGVRGMAFIAFFTFLPLYLDNELGMSPLARGWHLGLLVAVGVVSTPVMGYISDRLGRKLVLVPGILGLCVLSLLLVPFGEGVPLVLLLALLGLFLFSDQPILTAAVLDIVGREVATTTLGVLSFSRFVLSAASPLIAGGLYQGLGISAAFYYVAGLFALAAITLLVLPIKTTGQRVTVGHGH